MSTPNASADPIVALQKAITLAENGDRDTARRQLLTLTAEQPSFELAWLWLAAVTDDVETRVAVLRQVLVINPANDKARTALVRLLGDESSLPPRPAPKTAARATGTIKTAPNASLSDAAPSNANQGLSGLGAVEIVLIAILVVVILVVVVGGVALIGGRLRPTDTPTATNTPLATATRTPAKSYTPSITPGGPTETPYVPPTLPPSWTPVPSATPAATFTPRATDTPEPTQTLPSTVPPPTVAPIPTKGTPPTLPPLPTLPGASAATKTATTKSP